MSLKSLRWLGLSTALLVTYAALSRIFPKDSFALTAMGDLTGLALCLAAAAVALRNALREHGQTRVFWAFITAGCVIWSVNFEMWAHTEVFLHREIPDPFTGDIVLFLHVIPFIGAVAVRPHRLQPEERLHLGTLSFLMLLVWWVFLYGFVVFPDEYVVLNKSLYTHNYDRLYLFENLVLLGTLLVFLLIAKGAWRKVYGSLFAGWGLYTAISTLINAAIVRGTYYTGSFYDLPLLAALLLLIWSFAQAPHWNPKPKSQPVNQRWQWIPTRLAMLAMLSAPMMGMWALVHDPVAPRMHFRVAVTLATMVVLGSFIYVRQYLLDRQLLRLLGESRQSLENLQRLQRQLVQKEKLASVGQLAAGVAHEINNPLAAILGYSELLLSNTSGDHASTAGKIAAQAKRTRDLVARLLSFAQQSPAEKSLVQLGTLLQQALQLETLRIDEQKIAVFSNIAPDLPRVRGNASQLLQCFMQIIGNARDALSESGGGTLSVDAYREGNEVILKFSDSGPGMKDPERVFDPFYTTKAVGKGTGLGLSATYGIVQDHGGQITCQNRPEGGAMFIMRLPMAEAASAVQAGS